MFANIVAAYLSFAIFDPKHLVTFGVMLVLLWSVTVTVCVPTVTSVNVSCRNPPERLPVTGVSAGSVAEETRTASPTGT